MWLWLLVVFGDTPTGNQYDPPSTSFSRAERLAPSGVRLRSARSARLRSASPRRGQGGGKKDKLQKQIYTNLTWDWSFDGGKPAASGSGTLTTGPLSGGGYTITAISGNFGGFVINGLDSSYGYSGIPDQILYTPGNNGMSDTLLLSSKGLGFDTTMPSEVNISDQGGAYLAYVADVDSGYFGSFTAAPAAAPEPSQIVSMLALAGVSGATFLVNLRRRK